MTENREAGQAKAGNKREIREKREGEPVVLVALRVRLRGYSSGCADHFAEISRPAELYGRECAAVRLWWNKHA
jgi:hypothetical protein